VLADGAWVLKRYHTTSFAPHFGVLAEFYSAFGTPTVTLAPFAAGGVAFSLQRFAPPPEQDFDFDADATVAAASRASFVAIIPTPPLRRSPSRTA
jgi:hypothetical protein